MVRRKQSTLFWRLLLLSMLMAVITMASIAQEQSTIWSTGDSCRCQPPQDFVMNNDLHHFTGKIIRPCGHAENDCMVEKVIISRNNAGDILRVDTLHVSGIAQIMEPLRTCKCDLQTNEGKAIMYVTNPCNEGAPGKAIGKRCSYLVEGNRQVIQSQCIVENDYTKWVPAFSQKKGNYTAPQTLERNLFSATAYPNPVVQGYPLTVQFNLKRTADMKFKVFNVAGQQALDVEQYFSEGMHQLTINTSNLESGMYILLISGGTEKTHHRFTVTR